MGHIAHAVLDSIGQAILNVVCVREYVFGSKNSLCGALKPFPAIFFHFFFFNFSVDGSLVWCAIIRSVFNHVVMFDIFERMAWVEVVSID